MRRLRLVDKPQLAADTGLATEPVAFLLRVSDGRRVALKRATDVATMMRTLVVETTLGNRVEIDMITGDWPRGGVRSNDITPDQIAAIASAWCDEPAEDHRRALRRSSLRAWLRTMASRAEA